MPTLSAVIVAAGSSRRMGFDKLTAPLGGRPLLWHSLRAFEACAHTQEIILVCAEQRVEEFRALSQGIPKIRAVVPGGKERIDSVRAGVHVLGHSDFVAVHDGARPLITPAAIARCFAAAEEWGAAACAERVTDTLHRTDEEGFARETVPRDNLWRMQTPQIVRHDLLTELLSSNVPATDEISLVIRSGRPARMVENPSPNPKVTYPADLELVEILWSRLVHGEGKDPAPAENSF